MAKTQPKTTAGADSKEVQKADVVTDFNQSSRYEEPVIVPFLTLYDIERKPRAVQNTICKQPLNSLNNLFQCPVCLGYMKKTFIVMECLHRFCGECIQKCLRLGKKECPSCRVHIPSRRSLRPDLNYDALMKKIFGDIETLETNEEKEIETWNRQNNMNNAYTTRRKIDISKQAQLRKKGNKASKKIVPDVQPQPEGRERKTSTSTDNSIKHLEESKLIDFVLRPHPQEKGVARLHRECIRTSEEITIHHLKRFLGKKLRNEPYFHFQILLSLTGGKPLALDDDIKLKDVRSEMCDFRNGSVMILQYRRYIP